ncbi:MAG: hypothetical protein ACKVS6_13935 [Planctomycetota bacterium]
MLALRELQIALLSFIITSCAAREKVQYPPSVLSIRDSCFALLSENGDRGYNTKLIIAVWPDGIIVWSSNRQVGGEPYSWNRIPLDDVIHYQRNLANATLRFPEKHQDCVPHHGYYSWYVKNETNYSRLKTRLTYPHWNDTFVEDSNITKSDEDLAAERIRSQALAAWMEIYNILATMIPKRGEWIDRYNLILRERPPYTQKTDGN